MQSKLTNSQIEYLFYHLNLHFEFSDEIKNRIRFNSQSNDISQIIFKLSDKPLREIKYIDNIPLLFPLSTEPKFYTFDESNNLVFNDDLLKSAFYLLSGYQETLDYSPDQFGRYTYKESIQKKLNLSAFPLVNFYFNIIMEGIEKFCKINKISFNKRDIWNGKKIGFLLTHDVDRVDKYTIRNLKYVLKQFLGLAPTKLSRVKASKLLIEHSIKLFTKQNPYWNFEWMKSIENRFSLNSVWFFLPNNDKNIDAFYSFQERRIKNLVSELVEYGDEIGLHSTYYSIQNEKIMNEDFESVKNLIGENPVGNRQHWLRFKYPVTLRNLENLGIRYDSSWAFNDHIGWRNSYCLPFRPYDIKQDRMMNIWEFPLTVMDVTLFQYQNLSQNSALEKIDDLLDITERFNGLFTLLWHNSNFELENGEDLKDFYISVLEKIHNKKTKTILPNVWLKEI